MDAKKVLQITRPVAARVARQICYRVPLDDLQSSVWLLFARTGVPADPDPAIEARNIRVAAKQAMIRYLRSVDDAFRCVANEKRCAWVSAKNGTKRRQPLKPRVTPSVSSFVRDGDSEYTDIFDTIASDDASAEDKLIDAQEYAYRLAAFTAIRDKLRPRDLAISINPVGVNLTRERIRQLRNRCINTARALMADRIVELTK